MDKIIKAIQGVPVYDNGDFTYVKFSEIPRNILNKFSKWMHGQTGAVIDGENVAYSWDFERFIKGLKVID